MSAVREIKFLKSLQHKNIVQLKDVITSKGCEHIELPIQKSDIPIEPNKVATPTVEQQNNQNEKGNDTSNLDEDNGATSKNSKSNLSKWEPLKICGSLYLVFEFVEHDLGGLIDAKYKFSTKAVKTIVKQLFEVLSYLCEKKVLHRDIKCSNILITNKHQIKLADFGLARSALTSDGREFKMDMTNNVITMWYKPPELVGNLSSRYKSLKHPVMKNCTK